ncbi:MAG: hypothetical protein COV48_07700 [Elusimicrobia bacterium CG11_big_fil_rev_8_21_14_0_20_64_6]|nr:MAG: hypothetical protein COV48_07700 [Elusimicrobia bacterium CG11_big_fil_rev_8_21_14_0_20_64_6]
MTTFSIRRPLSAAVSFSLILACPGLAPYAAAQSIRSAPAASANTAAPAMSPITGAQGASFSIPSLMPSALSLTSSLGAPSAPAPLMTPAAAAVKALTAPAPLAAASASPLVQAAAARPAALSRTVSAAAKTTFTSLEKAGPIKNASASSASGLGQELENALTGAAAAKSDSDMTVPAFGDWAALNESRQLARPAGDLIAQAAAAYAAHSDKIPAPPADMTPAPRSPKGPFWPRLLSAGLALAPAVFLGLPLLAASAWLVGGLVMATSLTLAVMPFLSESSPKILRAAPGVTLAALGFAVAGVSLSLSIGLGVAVAPALAWSGALAIIGGWGLTRYGLGKTEGRYGSYGSIETLSAFFGGLAAMTGVALAASTPLGWTASALLWLSYPLSALLWFHLPGWIGKGMTAAIEGAWHGVLGLSRVLTAIHRDTVLLDRLEKFSERHWNASKWNAVWLAVMWTPIMLAEAAMYALSAAGGLVVGAVTAPVNFLWGASAKLWPESRLNVYFAEAARFVFDNVQNGKIRRFNPLEAKLIPLANSPKFLVSAAGSLGIRALQLGWLGYSLIAAPLLSVAGLMFAFGRVGAYDSKRHSTRSLRISRDDSPSEKPEAPTQPKPGPPAKASIAPKLIAVALALVPACFFGLPILAGHSLIQIPLYFGLVLPLAAMPFMGKAPVWVKSLAGRALFYNGLVLLLNGSAIWVGLIALLGGWGFGRWVKKTSEKGGSFDEAELGAFFGALGASAAVGAVWAGFLGGWIGWGTLALAAATSPFLLMHLPSWVWEGALGFLKSFSRSIKAFHDVAGFWHSDTEFRSNLRKHASYWLGKTYWNGVWLSAIWVPVGLIQAAEFLVSAALGAAIGLLRAPFAFAAAAFREAKPDSKAALFTRGLLDGWKSSSDGSKKLFDRLVSGLKPAMNEASPVTGRPTAKAAGAFLLARFVQLAWFIGALAMSLSVISLLIGLYRGVSAALAGPQKSEA